MGWGALDEQRFRFADVFAVVERARLGVGRKASFEIPERPTTLARAENQATATQIAKSGMVAVLTPDWDNCLMSQNEPINDRLTVTGASGAIDDVPGSGVEIQGRLLDPVMSLLVPDAEEVPCPPPSLSQETSRCTCHACTAGGRVNEASPSQGSEADLGTWRHTSIAVTREGAHIDARVLILNLLLRRNSARLEWSGAGAKK